MDKTPTSQIWWFRMTFVILALGLIFFRLLPLETTPKSWAGPEVLMAVIFAWSMRDPRTVPSLLIACAVFAEDLLLHREPGLQAALVVAAAAWLKLSVIYNPDQSALREWVLAAVAIIGVTLATRLVLTVFLTPLPQLTLHLSQMAMTIVIYPAVALMTHYIIGLRPIGIGDADTGNTRGRL